MNPQPDQPECGMMALPPQPRWKRLYRKWFNAYYEPLEIPSLPDGFKDGIVCETEVLLSFTDKLRLLFGCRLKLTECILVENIVGNTQALTKATVYLP